MTPASLKGASIVIEYTEPQLDALRELANIGSGTAATALARLLGRPVELAVPRALALPLADALDAIGPAGATVHGGAIPLQGDLAGTVLLIFSEADAATLHGLLDVEPGTPMADSALGEVANILGTAALEALGAVTGMALEPCPPQVVHDLLGAIVASLLTEAAGELDVALVLDAELTVAGAACALSFLLLPSAGAVDELLFRLGLGR